MPERVSYARGFVVIGVLWNLSHFGEKLLRSSDHGFDLLTLLFLACVSLTPFPVLPYVDHFNDPANVGAAALM